MNIVKRLWKKLSGASKQTGNMSLADAAPHLTSQWHPFRNGDVTPEGVTYEDSSTSYWWQCNVNSEHVWESPLSVRIHSYGVCPLCKREKHYEDIAGDTQPRTGLNAMHSPNEGVYQYHVGQQGGRS